MLRRLPAVQWAFGRLRPSPQVDTASSEPVALEHSSVVVADSTEGLAAVSADICVGSEPSRDITAVAVESATTVDLSEETSAGGPDVGSGPSCTTLADVETIIADDAPLTILETSDHSEIPDASTSADPDHSDTVDVELVAADEPVVIEVVESSPEALADIAGADESASSATADIEPVAVDTSPASLAALAEDAPPDRSDVSISSDPSHSIADLETVAAGEPAIADSTESSPEALADIVADESSCSTAADVEPVTVDASAASLAALAEEAPADHPDVSISSDPSHSIADLETVAADEPAIADSTESSPEVLADISGDKSSSSTVIDVEPVAVDAIAVGPIELAETALVDCPEAGISRDDAASEAVTVESAPIATAEAEEAPSASTLSITSTDEPPAVGASSAPDARDVPKAPAKAAEPIDRATLIRRRWAETGIRMWNPRLHGTGEAALNIQGRIELLPPEPGEKMPRYDKLEFRMLGGQIVCEGVIVEAPVHAGQRSFTVLAERRQPERAREAVPA
ncbi:hypothetical protein [Bradyrhizobium neotropicale]|uniref:Uncharacterized protein n=1 Tax=Bradyrhizobium neotropicale TaxID=1497615 RepID=A0A176ZF91_9BRAD|nr:hypothetical protein [Bradyrhizobium neotropicale]OAF18582.1 hypothetical protein AXW67_03455 [Bradyrhizobium neotropicale]